METRPVTPLEADLYEVTGDARVALFTVGEAEGWPETLHGTLLIRPEYGEATVYLQTDVGEAYGYLSTEDLSAVTALPENPSPADLEPDGPVWTVIGGI